MGGTVPERVMPLTPQLAQFPTTVVPTALGPVRAPSHSARISLILRIEVETARRRASVGCAVKTG